RLPCRPGLGRGRQKPCPNLASDIGTNTLRIASQNGSSLSATLERAKPQLQRAIGLPPHEFWLRWQLLSFERVDGIVAQPCRAGTVPLFQRGTASVLR